jgi:ATP-binding cassette subfamily B protein
MRLCRVPLVEQSGEAECGLAALEMLLLYFGVEYSRYDLRRMLGDTSSGLTMDRLWLAATKFGLDADGFEVPVELLGSLSVPSILHWRGMHFVVLEGWCNEMISIADPQRGRVMMTEEDFARHYSGTALMVAMPSPERLTEQAAAPRAGYDNLRLNEIRSWLSTQRIEMVALSGASAVLALSITLTLLVIGQAAGGLDVHRGQFLAQVALGSIVAVITGGFVSVREQRLVARLERYVGDQVSRMIQNASTEFLLARTQRRLEAFASDLHEAFSGDGSPECAVRYSALAASALLVLAWHSRTSALCCFVLVSAMAGGLWFRRASLESARRIQERRSAHSKEWFHHVLANAVDLRAAGSLEQAFDTWLRLRDIDLDTRGARAASSPKRSLLFAGGAVLVLIALGVFTPQWWLPSSSELMSSILLASSCVVASVLALRSILSATRLASRVCTLLDSNREGRPPFSLQVSSRCDEVGLLEFQDVALESSPGELTRMTNFFADSSSPVAFVGAARARAEVAQLATGIIQPSIGSVRISGYRPASMAERRRRLIVRGVLADAQPFGRTILEHFRVAEPSVTGPQIRDALETVELGVWFSGLALAEHTLLTRGSLQGVSLRLLCLARSLVNPPQVLVLGDVLDDLDTCQALRIAESITTIGATILLTTGRPDIVPPSFRRILR